MKDAKGHGSDGRGTHSAGVVKATGGWQTRLGFYSFGAGEVGKENRAPIYESHADAPAAMKALNSHISEGKAQTYVVVSPKGEHLPMNTVYRQHYGADPKYANRDIPASQMYPKLYGRK